LIIALIILAWKKETPMSTSDLSSYISVKFISVISGGLIGLGGPGSLQRITSNMRQQYNIQTLIQVWASVESSLGKIRNIIDVQGVTAKNEVMLGEKDLTQEQIDYLESDATTIIIDYNAQIEEL